MKEPFKLVKTIDESKITSTGSGSDSFVIGAVVNSPSGRTERVKVSNTAEFISEYLVNDSVTASDDITVQHVAKILDSSPVYVIRVDPSKVRVGYTSTKKKMYFDKNYNPLDSYTIAELDTKSADEDLKLSISIKLATDSDKVITFSNKSDGTTSNDEFIIQTNSIEEFLSGINGSYSDADSYEPIILARTNNTIVVNGEVVSQVGFNEIDFKSINLTGNAAEANLYKYKFSTNVYSSLDKSAPEELSYDLGQGWVSVGGSAGINFFTRSSEPDVNGKTKIYPCTTLSPYADNFPLGPFSVYLVDRLFTNTSIPSPTICKQRVSINSGYEGEFIPIGATSEEVFDLVDGTLSNLSCGGAYKDLAIQRELNDKNILFISARPESEVAEFIKSLGITESYVKYDPQSTNPNQYVMLDKFAGNGDVSNSTAITPSLFLLLLADWINVELYALNAPNNYSNFITIDSVNEVMYSTDVNPAISDVSNTKLIEESLSVSVDEVYNLVKHPTDETNSASTKHPCIFLKIKNTIFYSGSVPKGVSSVNTLVKLSSKELTLDEFTSELYSAFTSYFTGSIIATYDANGKQHNLILVNGDCPISVNLNGSDDSDTDGSSDGIEDDGNNNPLRLSMKSTLVQQDTTDATFAVVPNFPCSADLFRFSYTKNTTDFDPDQGVYNLNLYYKDAPSTYYMSFIDTVMDGYGNSLYYENINDKNNYLHIVKLGGTNELESMSSNAFGSEVILPKAKANDFKEAAAKFMDYEDVYYTVLWDAGAQFPTYSKYLETISSTATEENPDYLDCIAALSIPADCRDESSIASWSDSIGALTCRAVEYAPGYIVNAFGGFGSKFAASTAYIEKLIANYNSISAEFDPIYGPTSGLVTTPNLVCKLNKTARENLLDHRVNSIFEGKYGYQFNFNKTCQRYKSYVDEEQNVRIASAISHVCDKYAETLIGQFNTKVLRMEVESRLYDLIKARVVEGKNKCIEGIKVICNDENNTQDIIDNQELHIEVQVAYLRSIAYVTVYNKIKKIIA
jgi:hypothetical protein